MKPIDCSDRDAVWLAEIRAQLSASADELEPLTQARLRSARLRALDTLAASPTSTARRGLRPAWGITTLASLALGLLLWQGWQGDPPQPPLPSAEVSDFEIIVAEERLEFYQDLDFYLWLEGQWHEVDAPEAGSPSA